RVFNHLNIQLRIVSCILGQTNNECKKQCNEMSSVCLSVYVCVCALSSSGSKVLVHFVNQSGVKTSVFVTEGETLLDVVIKKNLDISSFGACEGTLACSTCHLIFEESVYDKLEPIVDEEVDMLDLAYGLTKTSRLGCQVSVEHWMDGMTVHVPQEINDQQGKQEAVSSK
uniref:Ferredoxin 1b n=1 Tax=Sinocyclocheilus rhinocerous TaxID=307959 RepID=A0A673NGY6_9TELE